MPPKQFLSSIFILAASIGISFGKEAPSENSAESVEWVENNMVLIPSGTFQMGSEEQQVFERPVHKVILDAFYMDKTEVTQKEFQSLMGRNPAFHDDDLSKPVEQVTWFDAVLFCNARSERDGLEPAYRYTRAEFTPKGNARMLYGFEFDASKNGYRLPTEAQWEYACRAGTTTTYFWGDAIDDDYLWWALNSDDQSHPVATKRANPWGLYDMVGSVWEWTNDWFDHYPSETQLNPTGPDSWGIERVLRGGSFRSHDGRDKDLVTSATRGWTYPYAAWPSDGFRCVKPANPDYAWITLFNGIDLDGWVMKFSGSELNENYNNTFQVKDGVLKVSYDNYDRFDNRYGHLFYKHPFSYYHLQLEYRFVGEKLPDSPWWTANNSGVMIHSQDPETMPLISDPMDESVDFMAHFPISVECQLLGNAVTANAIQIGTAFNYEGEPAKERSVNSNFEHSPADRWMKLEIVVLGDSVVHHIADGNTVLTYTNLRLADTNKPLSAGYIALQAESQPVEFRNIRLRKLN